MLCSVQKINVCYARAPDKQDLQLQTVKGVMVGTMAEKLVHLITAQRTLIAGILGSLLALWVVDNAVANKPAAFNFILHDGLSESDIVHIQMALTEKRPAVLAALGLAQMPTVTVQIWHDETRYQDAMESTLGMRAPGSRGYVTGATEIRLLRHQQLSAQREAVHEFAHAATLTLNPDFGNNPRWLWEAAAIYLAGEFVDPRVVEQFRGNQCPSLATLNSPFDRGGSIYSSGYLLGEFIVTQWGVSSLPDLVSSNGNTEAVLNVSETEFEDRWCAFVQEKYLQ